MRNTQLQSTFAGDYSTYAISERTIPCIRVLSLLAGTRVVMDGSPPFSPPGYKGQWITDYHIELGEFPAMPQAQRTQRHHRTQKPHKRYPHAIMLDDPRQDDDDFQQRHPLPEETELLKSLEKSIQACHTVLNTHGEGCPCNVCYDVNGLLYNLYSGRDLIDCLL